MSTDFLLYGPRLGVIGLGILCIALMVEFLWTNRHK